MTLEIKIEIIIMLVFLIFAFVNILFLIKDKKRWYCAMLAGSLFTFVISILFSICIGT